MHTPRSHTRKVGSEHVKKGHSAICVMRRMKIKSAQHLGWLWKSLIIKTVGETVGMLESCEARSVKWTLEITKEIQTIEMNEVQTHTT